MAELPPIGAEIPCSSIADASLQMGSDTVQVTLRGGFKHRAEANPDDPARSVRMRLTGLKYSGEIPGDTVTLELDGSDADPKGLLTQTQKFPPKFEHRVDLSTCTLTFARPGSTLVLTPKGDAVLVARLSQFPPRGDLYELAAPVEFVDPAMPDSIAAVLEKFPAKVGGL
ncbi:hypothetical protein ACFV1L_33085 [Kitasatospora sp. NPDC059646]|uniref:hypothetical protein n=1 Tax=Kitasatospora sp. NPDC059646 TaxID=3346893 RepID=UPI00367A707C